MRCGGVEVWRRGNNAAKLGGMLKYVENDEDNSS